MSIRFVLFDLGDTLVHKPALIPAISFVLTRNRIAIDPDQLMRTHRRLREEIIFPDRTDREVYRDFNSRFLEALGLTATDALVSEIYEACRGLPWVACEDTRDVEDWPVDIGIVSNWDDSLDEVVESALGLDLGVVIGSARVGFAKPDRRIYDLAAHECGCAPDEIMMIGDSIRLDIAPAESIGMKAILLDRYDCWTDFAGERVSSLNLIPERLQRP